MSSRVYTVILVQNKEYKTVSILLVATYNALFSNANLELSDHCIRYINSTRDAAHTFASTVSESKFAKLVKLAKQNKVEYLIHSAFPI